MDIDTIVTFEVHCSDYSYKVEACDDFSVTYCENDKEHSSLSFGSAEEMEAVAKAMLQAVKLHREM